MEPVGLVPGITVLYVEYRQVRSILLAFMAIAMEHRTILVESSAHIRAPHGQDWDISMLLAVFGLVISKAMSISMAT